ncbi:hypothetical protein [Roseinatronobacter alkalisoli]|uniref:Uncharacterized protein n=1 Tax=Roseinatronobacter alkalisoli TaxID=3028235 RepID=A0ABT5TBH8_9RHOB|nr:hypothetical protein [Roseinatronobacter sp. HJB301]MDD7972480.1 hypothetical protein [Roseinatronobacter sp. HJB301]
MADKKDHIKPINASFDDLVGAVVPRATPLHVLEDESIIAPVELKR